jgi:hypothetical protein
MGGERNPQTAQRLAICQLRVDHAQNLLSIPESDDLHRFLLQQAGDPA